MPAWWATVRHGQNSGDVADHGVAGRPLVCTTSGLPCTDYCPLGQQKRNGGQTTKQHGVFLATRSRLAQLDLEDMYWTECSSSYAALVRQKSLDTTHHIVATRTGPEFMSFPVRRCRGLAAGMSPGVPVNSHENRFTPRRCCSCAFASGGG